MAQNHPKALGTQTMVVSVVNPRELAREPRRQLVSSAESLTAPPLVETPLLSDRDSSAARELVKRGDAPDAAPKTMPPPATKSTNKPVMRLDEKAPAGQPSSKKQGARGAENSESPQLRSLSLDSKSALQQFGAEGLLGKAADQEREVGSGYEAFSRPSGSGARIVGTEGIPDFLPNLPDGDITMLNAKADKFAVFVRRVALQVFSELRHTGWETLSARDVRSIGDFTTIEAVLSLNGDLEAVTIHGQSGSSRFDNVVAAAVRRGGRDPNPPPAAVADDGKIHFIFKARSWSRHAVDGRTGRPFEQRWLLLSTGLN